MRKDRAQRLRDGQVLFNKFYEEPDFDKRLTRSEAVDMITYVGYSVPAQALEQWVKSNKIGVISNMDTGDYWYQGREIYQQCNDYKRKQISKSFQKPSDGSTVIVNLEPEVKKFFVSMAHREDTTVPTLLSQYLNELGQEKLREIDQRIREDIELLREKHIGEMSL